MPFFDFHLHPSLKPQMSAPTGFPSPWEQIKIKFNHPNVITLLLKCNGINEVVDSQASLTQLIDAKMNLVAIALHPPETAMMNDGLIQQIAAEEQTSYINLDRINAIGTGNIYFQMMNEELNNLKSNLSNNGRKLKIINQFTEYNAADLHTVHAILIIEGPHAFQGATLPNGKVDFPTFWNNFETFTNNNRIFSINISHLQENAFCNHAFGIQIFKPAPFYPKGNGVTPEGFQLLQKMQAKNILLDIKHTSLFARTQLFAAGVGANRPVVCTHAGLTGIKRADRGKYFIKYRTKTDRVEVSHNKPLGYLSGTSFNPSTINLYDEDVKEVVFSGGLIGLSMDQRILGTPEEWMMSIDNMGEIYEEEIISLGERDFFVNVSRSAPDKPYIIPSDISTADKQDWPRFHARHFLNQVFHLFVICDEMNFNKAQMAKLICIGSDFDGMINPIDCCKNVTQLESFKNNLLDNFINWEKELTNATGLKISSFISPTELLENIFYKNGVEFLRQWY